MRKCDFIVIGGSAGAIEATQRLVKSFPADLPASVLIVLHVSALGPSLLPEILSRAGPLPAKHPEDGESICPGRIYVAPPDRHLIVEDGVVRITRGPRENRHRPAIDPLFRTAARTWGQRVIGVILSGHLDDGAAGLHAIRSRGGIAVVQDPADAGAPEMPESALKYSGADHVLPIAQMGAKLIELACRREVMKQRSSNAEPERQPCEDNLYAAKPAESCGTPSVFACPECHGVLWEFEQGELVRFRCRVGHAYTMANLAEEQVRATEDALWAAMRALEEKAALATRISDTSTLPPTMKQRLDEQAEADRQRAAAIRELLFLDDKTATSQEKANTSETTRRE